MGHKRLAICFLKAAFFQLASHTKIDQIRSHYLERAFALNAAAPQFGHGDVAFVYF